MSFADYFSSHIAAGSLVAFPLVLLGGVISAFNPCCLPMIPSVVLLVGNHSALNKVKGAFIAAIFVLGFAAATAAMGAATASLGLVFGRLGKVFSYLAAGIPILMALQLWGVIQFRIPAYQFKPQEGRHGGAILTGVFFALVFTSCATPIVASILVYASTKSVVYGTSLLFVYGLGAGIPLIIMGSFMGFLGALSKFNAYRKRINFATAVSLMAFGLYLIWVA